MFKLSNRSLSRLEGVNSHLVKVVKRAIELTSVDFAVTEGLRTLEKQQKLVAQGRSQTLNSKLILGNAVDLMAWVDGEPCWELNVYDEIADAMKKAAIENNVPIRWGAAWHIDNICEWKGSMEDAMNAYVDLRRSQGRRPFIDGPHFEIP